MQLLQKWFLSARKKQRFLGYALFFAGIASGIAQGQEKPFTFSQSPGPYSVGFRVVDQYDYSRTYREPVDIVGQPYHGERARPVQTLIWYPAEKSSKQHLTLGDYFALEATDEDFSPSQARVDAAALDTKPLDGSRSEKMWAIKDAVPVKGKFPVVIYAASFSAQAFENPDLCEYLASHGYLVLASPSLGAHGAMMDFDQPSMDPRSGIEAQASDISFLIGYAQTLPQADVSHVAVAGYSWGGISNLFAAARDSRIDALVFLDGSARYFPDLVADAKYIHPDQITIPMLFFTSHDHSLEDYSKEKNYLTYPDVLDEVTHSDLTILHMRGMTHGQFSSLTQRDPEEKEKPGEYSQDEAIESYGWVARYTLAFLDAHLKQDAAAAAFIKRTPVENGVPSHLVWVDDRPAKGAPPSMEEFRRELAVKGFDHASEVYEDMKKQNPGFKIDQFALMQWADELKSAGYPTEADQISKFKTSLYP